MSASMNHIYAYIQSQKPYCSSPKPTSGQADRKEIFDKVVERSVPKDPTVMDEKVQEFFKKAKNKNGIASSSPAAGLQPKRRHRNNNNIVTDAGGTNKNSDEKEDDDDLLVDSEEIPLICPLSKNPITIPARFRQCKHLRCCDLVSWISSSMQHRSSRMATLKMTCPSCNNTGSPLDAEVDLFQTSQIMKYILESAKFSNKNNGNIVDMSYSSLVQNLDVSCRGNYPLRLKLYSDGSIEDIREQPKKMENVINVDDLMTQLSQNQQQEECGADGSTFWNGIRIKPEPNYDKNRRLSQRDEFNEEMLNGGGSDGANVNPLNAAENGDDTNDKAEFLTQFNQQQHDNNNNNSDDENDENDDEVQISEPLPIIKGRPFCHRCQAFAQKKISSSNNHKNSNSTSPVIPQTSQQQATNMMMMNSTQTSNLPPDLRQHEMFACPLCGLKKKLIDWSFVWPLDANVRATQVVVEHFPNEKAGRGETVIVFKNRFLANRLCFLLQGWLDFSYSAPNNFETLLPEHEENPEVRRAMEKEASRPGVFVRSSKFPARDLLDYLEACILQEIEKPFGSSGIKATPKGLSDRERQQLVIMSNQHQNLPTSNNNSNNNNNNKVHYQNGVKVEAWSLSQQQQQQQQTQQQQQQNSNYNKYQNYSG